MQIVSFKELIVWQRSMDLAKEVYKVTEKLPQKEMFGMQSQMRRAAVSIPSNIAEGKKRKTRKDFLQFLHIADGSAAELETQILLAQSLYTSLDFTNALHLLEEVQKMLSVMIKKLSVPSTS